MKLADFPNAIASAQMSLLQSERAYRDFQLMLDRSVADIKIEIAFDANLKNEHQREARRLELMRQPGIEALTESIEQLRDEQTRKAIEVELLQNQYTVAKLAQRRAIAQMEVNFS